MTTAVSAAVSKQSLKVLIAKTAAENSQMLGRHRWVVGRTLARQVPQAHNPLRAEGRLPCFLFWPWLFSDR
jgi:hypothetical protein